MFLLIVFIVFFFWDSAELSHTLHSMCLSHLNFDSSVPELYQALLCGKRLPNGEFKSLFVRGGLIHLTVISGAHLIFLKSFILKWPLPNFLKKPLILLFLIFYALCSHLHAPVLRALFSFFLFELADRFKLFWNPFLILFLSAFLCLLYRPELRDSFSLQLSVLASLLYYGSKNSLSKCLFIYGFTLPIINHWQELSPLSVLSNWILAPIISAVLFPLSVLCPFCPFLYPITDWLWMTMIQLLRALQFFQEQKSLFYWSIPKPWIWPYILGLWFSLTQSKMWSKKRLAKKIK